MKTKKFRILKIAAVICFIFAILEYILAGLIAFSPVSEEITYKLVESAGVTDEDLENMDAEIDNKLEESVEKGEIAEEDANEAKSYVSLIIRVIIAVMYCIEATFFIVEGFLIYRAIKKGKTTLIIVFLIIGIASQLLSLINTATHNSYDINSLSDLISLIIKTVILKQVFEIRRINND